MAVLQVVSVYDVAVSAYNRPFFVPTLGAAVRSFEDECTRASGDNPIYNHPSDFSLFHLGTFDEESGRFVNLDNPVRLVDAGAVVQFKEVNHAPTVPQARQ